MNDVKMVRLPKAIVNEVGAYFDTRNYVCARHMSFDKSLVLERIHTAAEKHNYTIEGETGTFILRRKACEYKVTKDSFPQAIKIH